MGHTRHRTPRRAWTIAAAALVAVPVLVTGPAAFAAGTNWWYDQDGVPAATAAGWTGKGIKVAVIDDQIIPTAPVFTGAHLTVDPTPLCSNSGATPTTTNLNSYHGSGVTAMIVGTGGGPGAVRGVSPSADVTFYGWGRADDSVNCAESNAYGAAVKKAVESGAKIITTSIVSSPNAETAKSVAWALSKGVILVSGEPNNATEAKYPAAYNGIVGVNAVDRSGVLQKNGSVSDVQPDTTVLAAGVGLPDATSAGYTVQGSSLAAPLVAGMLADVWQKYPKATANQLIQSLIRNTTPGAGTNGYGHGIASLTKMLAVDPTQYPDVNPLMNKASGVPTAAQVLGADVPTVKATTKPGGNSPSTAQGSNSSSGNVAVGFVIIGVVLLLVLAGIAVLVVFIVRRSQRSQVSRG